MLGVVLLTAITVLLTVLAERAYNVPREIRHNNERIRNRDEDLRTWIEDNRRQVRQGLLDGGVAHELLDRLGIDSGVDQ